VLRRLAYAFGRWNRSRKAAFAVEFARRCRVETALLVGVAGEASPINNLIEARLQAELPYVVSSGLAPTASGWHHFVVADGRRLPFSDGAFDLVYANAVIEHVGDDHDQQSFLMELARVGNHWIVTTPNRWFPIEAHFHTLFTHWRRGWAPRGGVTRLLGKRDLASMVPNGRVRGLPVISPTLTATGVGRRA
jgi:hypothetical protein